MHSAQRRTLVKAALAAFAMAPAWLRAQAGNDGATIIHARDASITRLPPNAEAQKSFDSAAARAAKPGRWTTRMPLPFPRSEMAWAAAWNGRMHVVGGYGNLRFDRAYHHIYDAAKNAWTEAAPLPRGASHIGVAIGNGVLYAVGGFIDQIRLPHQDVYAFDIANGEWRTVAPLPRARGRFSDCA